MEVTPSDIQAGNPTYDKETLFDLQAGMPVYGSAGSKIGIVTEVAGFGSTHLGPVPPTGSDDRVTQAQTGTGFFKVKRDGGESIGTPDLCIPFHAIHEVTAERGVIVNGTFDAGLRPAVDVADQNTPTTRSGGWRKWLPNKKV
jgi:hypothetical protein